MHQRQQQQQPYHQSTVINGLQAQYYRQYPAEHLIWYPKLWCQQHEVNCLTKKIPTTILVQIKMIMEELVVFKVELKFITLKKNILIKMLRYFKSRIKESHYIPISLPDHWKLCYSWFLPNFPRGCGIFHFLFLNGFFLWDFSMDFDLLVCWMWDQ